MWPTTILLRLASKLNSGFILAFHEIPPDRFSEFLDALSSFKAVHLDELIDRSKNRRSTSGLFAITIDDGVGENVRSLAAIANARQLPTTFYLPTEYLDTGMGMAFQWWNRVWPLIQGKTLSLKEGALDLSAPGASNELYTRVLALFHTAKKERYLPLIMEIVDIMIQEEGVDVPALLPPPPITWPEVAQLCRNDLLRFESHGVSHTAMSALSADELDLELKRSRDIISEHTGRLCRHLAYPFGSPESIGALAPQRVEKFYESATTMTMGPAVGINPMAIPRIPLYPSNSLDFAKSKIIVNSNVITARLTSRTSAPRILSRMSRPVIGPCLRDEAASSNQG